jgi:von Willebrand factor A domain-containing protein 5
MLPIKPTFKDIEIINSEFIFVVDCSGSMSGGPIKEAKNAMKFFFQSLPDGVKFNILKFGSNFTLLNQKSLDYSNENLEIARKYIDKIDADLGGTELFKPLEFLLKNMQLERGYSRF